MEYKKGYVYELMDKDVPDNVIVGGVPAKVIKILDEKEQKEVW